MDQKSNGTTTDKRNWRERLGIGTHDMPKLSDEFKSQPPAAAAPKPAPPAGVRPAPAAKAPQPVIRPAPMAPRPGTAKPAPHPAANGQPRPAAPAPMAPSPSQEALAEKLRAQRAAAEKLAEQRVQAARERAEAKAAPDSAAADLGRSRPPELGTSKPPVGRPKFSFADDATPRREPAPAPEPALPPRSTGTGPLIPPRPALGGERSQPPFLRPSALGQPGARPEPPPAGYRPIDPATGYPMPPARPPAATMRPYGSEPGTYPPRLPPRPPVYDPYARAPEPGHQPEPYGEELRGDPRLSRAPVPRGRARSYEPENEEVFEDEPPRRRASARDYQSAYSEPEEGYEEDRRRSNGPLYLLGALLAAGLAFGGILWYYNVKIKPGTATTQTQSDSVPMVAAPEQPAKTAPEQPSDTQGLSPAAKKKQIYDRIVGDREVTGDQVVPTEEVPVQPEPAAAQGVDQGTANEIPQPAGAPAAAPATDEPAPLPLPPPPGNDTQGSLDQTGIEKMASAASADPPPLPEPAPAAAGAADTEQASPPSPETPAVVDTSTVTDEPVVKPAKPKPTAATTTTKKKTAEPDLGAEPVVLVPPSQQVTDAASPTQGTAAEAPATTATTEPAKKKKTIFDLFKGSSGSGTTAQPQTQQVASAEPQPVPETPTAPAPAPSTQQAAIPAAPAGGPGYYLQLASFRTQSEAQAESARLQAQHANIIGSVPSSITQATVAGSTRYRVGLGPVASREQANKLCNSLFAAGERDCIVRGQ